MGSSWLTVTHQLLAPTMLLPARGGPRRAQRGSFQAFLLAPAGKTLVMQLCLCSEM